MKVLIERIPEGTLISFPDSSVKRRKLTLALLQREIPCQTDGKRALLKGDKRRQLDSFLRLYCSNDELLII